MVFSWFFRGFFRFFLEKVLFNGFYRGFFQFFLEKVLFNGFFRGFWASSAFVEGFFDVFLVGLVCLSVLCMVSYCFSHFKKKCVASCCFSMIFQRCFPSEVSQGCFSWRFFI